MMQTDNDFLKQFMSTAWMDSVKAVDNPVEDDIIKDQIKESEHGTSTTRDHDEIVQECKKYITKLKSLVKRLKIT